MAIVHPYDINDIRCIGKSCWFIIVPPSQLSSMYYLYGLFEVIIMIIIEIPIIKIIHRVSEKWEKAKRKAVKR